MAGGDQQLEVAVGKWRSVGVWAKGLRDEVRETKRGWNRRREFGGGFFCGRGGLPLQRRAKTTMRTTSRISPIVLPPITYMSPNIGVVNAVIIFLSANAKSGRPYRA